MKRLLHYMKSSALESVLAPLFKLLEALFELFVPLVVAQMIDAGSAGGEGVQSLILTRGALLLALGAVGLASAVTAQYFAAKAAAETGRRLRSDLFRRVLSLPRRSIDSVGTATLINRVSGDVDAVQTGVNMFLRLFLRSPFVVAGAMAMSFAVDKRISLVFAVTVALLTLIVWGLTRLTMPMFKRSQQASDELLLSLRENLTGVRVVRAFGREDDERAAFGGKAKRLFDLQRLAGRTSALMNPLTYTVVNLAVAAVITAGGRRVDSGALTAGGVVALVNYMSQILVELLKVANLTVTMSRAGASLSRVNCVFALETEDEGGTAAVPQSFEGPLLRADGLSFCYHGGEHPAVDGVSFELYAGQTLGVIGGTGSGKTTLVQLVSRVYDPDSGSVSLRGTDLRKLPRSEVKRRIAVVSQRTELYSGTLREALAWGDENAGDEEMFAALDAAQASGFVKEKGMGLDLPLGQRGRELSGGQRQRVSIARALLRKPDVLILDDASSALDYATDAAMRRGVARYAADSAVITVSQRVSSVMHADRILLLDEGRPVGCGTHAELLESCPLYREICASQSQGGDAR